MVYGINEMSEKLDTLTEKIDSMLENITRTTQELEKLIDDTNELAKSIATVNSSEAAQWDEVKVNEAIKARIDKIEARTDKLKKKLHETVWSIDSVAEKVHLMAEDLKQETTGRW